MSDKDHGEPPDFAKWLIWLFRTETWSEQPVIAAVAAVIAISIAATAVYGVINLFPSDRPGDGQRTAQATEAATKPEIEAEAVDPERKVVVLMDSTLPEVVYDAQTRSSGGTNADDISEAIDELPIQIVKETTSLLWDRDEQVRQLDPDLIVIHLSAFYDKTTPEDGDRKLETFLRFIAGSQTQLILYTRVFESEGERTQWTRQLETRIPQLRDRVRLVHVPGGGSATFRDATTSRRLKLLVKETLGI